MAARQIPLARRKGETGFVSKNQTVQPLGQDRFAAQFPGRFLSRDGWGSGGLLGAGRAIAGFSLALTGVHGPVVAFLLGTGLGPVQNRVRIATRLSGGPVGPEQNGNAEDDSSQRPAVCQEKGHGKPEEMQNPAKMGFVEF